MRSSARQYRSVPRERINCQEWFSAPASGKNNFPILTVAPKPVQKIVVQKLVHVSAKASAPPHKLVMDTSFATPADPFSLWRPRRAAQGSSASPAIGSTTGPLVAYDDMVGTVRPQQASRGAIEPLAA